MANLRKKYFSIALNQFVDLDTNQAYVPDTSDINTGPADNQKIRLISFGEDIDSSRFTQVIADLIYNDIQTLAASEQAVEVLSDGVFRDVNQEFAVQTIETDTFNMVAYPIAIAISGGQLRKNHSTHRKEINSFSTVGDVGVGSPTVNNIDTTNIVPYMLVSNPNIPANTYVLSVGVNSITLSENASGTALATSIVFSDEQFYAIGAGLTDFSLTGVFPKYRRVMIELDVTTGLYNVVTGPEQSKRLPINTQLDVTNANSLGLYSLLLFKNSAVDPTVIYSVDRIWEYVGLVSGVIEINRAELDKGFDGTYSIHTQEYEHLRDSAGDLLDWEEGQSSVSRPFIGDSYTDLHVFEETQLPQSYDALNSSSPVIIPFVVRNENVNDNYSASSTVTVKRIELGMKNSPAFIGDEGVAVQMVTADTVFDFTASETAKNGSPSTTQLYDNSHDFTLPINGYTVQVNDFVLILDNGGPPGMGDFQIAKITAIATNTLSLSGLTKPIENGSKYNIFKNGTEVNVGSEAFIDNVSLRSQVLSGVNGRFGAGDNWSRVAIEYGTSPTIDVDKYYFMKVRGYNINPPVWGILPWITIDKPQPTPTDNEKRNAYFRLFYNSFAGTYPNGNLLIEDEFGDINVDVEERTFAPHFRPRRYYLIARALDYIPNNIESGMNSDDVFVDVHTGKIKFKTGYEPRRVFVSYFKKDEINGDSFSAEIKFKNLENSDQINVQDKINEIDNRFKKGADIQEPSRTNGLTSFEERTFRGSYELDAMEPNDVKLVDGTTFDMFNSDDRKVVQLSGNYSDEIVDAEETRATLKHRVLKDTESRVRDVVVSSASDFIYGPPRVGLTTNDDQVLPSSDRIASKNSLLLKQFNESELATSAFDHNLNRGFFNESQDVGGKYNDLFVRGYHKNTVVRAVMRKSSTEALTYPLPESIKRLTKTRDVLALLGPDLAKGESDNQIVSEHFFQKLSFNFDESSFNKKHFIAPYTEIVDYYKHKFIAPPALNAVSVQASNISKHHEMFDQKAGKLVIAYADPTSTPNANELKIRVYDAAPGATKYRDYESITLDVEYANATAFEIVKVKVVPINSERFAVVYILNDAIYKIHAKIYSYQDGLIYTTTSPISFEGVTDLGVHTDAFMDAVCFDESFIVIAWKKNSTESGFRIFYLEDYSMSSEITFSNDSIYENMQVIPFSYDSFLIAYSYSGSLRMKQFRYTTDLVLFGASDYLEVSNNLIANGFFFKAAELQNNNIAFVYSESAGANIEVYVRILDEYSRALGAPIKISIAPVPSGSRHKDFSCFTLDNNCFAISYRDDSLKPVLRVFQNDGQETFHRYSDQSVLKSSMQTIRLSDRTMLSAYAQSLTSFKFDVIEHRPDFESILSSTSAAFQYATGLTPRGISSVRVSDDMVVVAFVDDGANQDGYIMFIDPRKYDLAQSTGYSIFKFHDASVDGDLEFHTSSIMINHTLPAAVKAIGVAYTKVGSDSEISWIDISTTTPSVIGVSSITAGLNAFPSLIKLSETRAVVAYGVTGFGYTQDIDLVPLDTASVPTHGADQAFKSNTISRPYAEAIQLNLSGDVTTIALTYDDNSLVGNLTIIDVSTPVHSVLNTIPFEFSSSQIANTSKCVLSRAGILVIGFRDFATTNLLMSLVDVSIPANPKFVSSFSNPYTVVAAATSDIDVIDPDYVSLDDSQVLFTYKSAANDFEGIVVDFTTPATIAPLGPTVTIQSAVTADCHAARYHGNHLLTFYRVAQSFTRRFECLFLRASNESSLVHSSGSPETLRAYLSSSIKILGVDWSGRLVRPIEISRSLLNDLPVLEGVVQGAEFESRIASSSVAAVFFNPKTFGVFYHKHDFQANNQVFLRLFRVHKQRFFSYSAEIALGANFSWVGDPVQNIYLHAQNADGDRAVLVYKNPTDGLIKKALVDSTGAVIGASYGDVVQTDPSGTPDFSVLGLRRLRNGHQFVLTYDGFDDSYRTTILAPDASSEVHQAVPFGITKFIYPIDGVTKPSVDNFGNCTYAYYDGTDHKVYQHGVDGKFGATMCVVGLNELNNLKVSKEAVLDKEVVPFWQFKKVKDQVDFSENLDDVGDFKFKMNIKAEASNWPFYRITKNTQDISASNWPELVPYMRGICLQDNDGNDYELTVTNYHTPDASSIVLQLDASDPNTALVLEALDEDRKYFGYSESLTSVLIGTGLKTFTTQPGMEFYAGDAIVAKYDSSNYMVGTVSSYSGTTLVINVASVVGTGTYGAWQIQKTSGWKSVTVTQGFYYLPAYEALISDIDLTNSRITLSKTETPADSVVAILNMDGIGGGTTFLDTSKFPKVFTANGGSTDVTSTPTAGPEGENNIKQGLTSLYQAGTNGDYISSPDHPDWDFNTGDFTISAWVYNQFANATSDILRRTSDITVAADRKYAIEIDHSWSNRKVRWLGNFGGVDIATPNETVGTAPVGSTPIGVASGFGSIWTTDNGANTVTRVNKTTLATVTIPLATGTSPHQITEFGGYMWVTCASGHVERIDPGTNSATTWANTVGFALYGIAVTGSTLWVLQYGAPYTLRQVNTAAPGFLASVNLADQCYLMTGDATHLYLLGINSTTVYKVDPSVPSIVDTWNNLTIASNNFSIMEDGDYVWVSSQSNQIVERFRKSDGVVVNTIPFSGYACCFLAKNDKYVFVSTYTSSSSILMIHRETGEKAGVLWDGNEFLQGYGITHDGDNLWLANYSGNTIKKIIGKGYLRTRGWTKIDVVRELGQIRIYIDHELMATGADATNYNHVAPLYIGAASNTSSFNGNIDQLVIVKGEALYSGNSYTENSSGKVKFYPFRVADSTTTARMFKAHASTVVTHGLNTVASLQRRDHVRKHQHPIAAHANAMVHTGGIGDHIGGFNLQVDTVANLGHASGDPIDTGLGAGTPPIANYGDPRHTGVHAYIYGKKYVSASV